MDKLYFFDTTLRDGEQTPGVNLHLSEKVEIARKLEKLGVDIIEAGFPASSSGDYEAVKAVSQAVTCTVAALCRTVDNDIRKAWEALKNAKKPRLHIFIATSPIHMKYKLRLEPAEVLEHIKASVTLAKSLCADIEFSAEDASRTKPEFLYAALQTAVDAGATTINIPDTVGYVFPDEFSALIKGVFENVHGIEDVVVSVHCHNDLGMATANTLAAISAGARQVECTINGLGERAGNAALEEAVMALQTRAEHGQYDHSIDTTRIYHTSQVVSRLTSVALPVCKAVVGVNAFTHESGIHQHGMMTNALTYEIMTPQSIGKHDNNIVLGKHSGRHAFLERLHELGYTLSEEDIDWAFKRFKELADKKKSITDRDLEAICSEKIARVAQAYELESFQLQSGSNIKSIASVSLMHEGILRQEAAIGPGPVDAAYNAIERIVGGNWPLASYDIQAVTEGEDALGEVTVRIRVGPKKFTGKGLSGNVIDASIRAYVNAINRAIAEYPDYPL